MTSDQLKDLQNRAASLKKYLNIEERKLEIEDKEHEAANPAFWTDPEKAEAIMKVLRGHKRWVNGFEKIADEIGEVEVLEEFRQLEEATEEDVDTAFNKALVMVEDLEFRSTLNKPEDELNATLEINSGAGGTEAQDWAEMLLRMYTMYCNKEGFKMQQLSRTDGNDAGIKSVQIEVTGEFAYGLLKAENGVHRLVRVSPFNAQGKRMTSFASVFVHPVVDDTIEIEINPADLSWDTFRASGAGGQHVNKTESAVRVTHQPTGLVAECQQERSQHQNREKALILLKSRLYQLELEKQAAERNKIENNKMANEWGSQIRSYVLDDRRVKDHRTGHQTSQTESVLNGEITSFIKAFLQSNFNG